MLRGFATVSYYADDLAAAEQWYADLLGIDAYFHVPGYTEFRVGDDEDELGLIDGRYRPPGPQGAGGQIVFWHVDELEASLERVQGLGATLAQPIIDRGEGFRTAVVVDPFGNQVGLMQNPHWAERHA
jgi:predicted enzyme related to lactoylglutathione lyase